MQLACDKSGSRVLDKLWLVASVKQKVSIAEELLKHEHRLQGDDFGRYASLVITKILSVGLSARVA